MIEIIEPGSRVTLHDDVEARVLRVKIYQGNCVEYEVAWWPNGDRHTANVIAAEIVESKARVKVGFGR